MSTNVLRFLVLAAQRVGVHALGQGFSPFRAQSRPERITGRVAVIGSTTLVGMFRVAVLQSGAAPELRSATHRTARVGAVGKRHHGPAAARDRDSPRCIELASVPDAESVDQFEVHIFVADDLEDQDRHRYITEHWFADRPEIETLEALLDGAKRTYALLYPGVDAENFSLELRRLRPRDMWTNQEPPASRPS